MQLESLILEHSLVSILIRFVINICTLFIVIRLIYFRFTKKGDFLFSFFMMGIIIFLICALLRTVDIQLGMALGLFAIFSILRFRTVNYSVKDMTYIFTVIGISVINSQANIPPPVIGAVVINSSILLAAYILEVFLLKNNRSSVVIQFNKMELIKPSNRAELIRELSAITGQAIEKVTIIKIDANKGNAELEAFFKING